MASVRKSPARVFLDSSVFFAAALSPTGAGRELFLQGLRGNCLLLITDFVLEETRRNLINKVPEQVSSFDQLRQLPGLRMVASPARAQILRVARAVEAKDAPIVAGALRGRADYLATYDSRHLLSQAQLIESAFGIVVAAPSVVLTIVRDI